MAIENLFQKDYTDQGDRENIPVKEGLNVSSMQIVFISKLYFWLFPQ